MTDTHPAIFHGEDEANANSGVKTKMPIMQSCTDILAPADKMRDDCVFSPRDRRRNAVRRIVDSDEASWVGFNEDSANGN